MTFRPVVGEVVLFVYITFSCFLFSSPKGQTLIEKPFMERLRAVQKDVQATKQEKGRV
jgi:hypothetical protein